MAKFTNIGVLSQIPNLCNELVSKLPAIYSIQNVKEGCTSKDLQNFDVIVGDYDLVGPHLYDLPKAKLFQGTWAGLDALMPYVKDVPPMPILRFSGEHFGCIISEYVVASIVNHERDYLKMHENQLNKIWAKDGKIHDYRTIFDLSIGILGIGQIGQRVSEFLKRFGANIKALGRQQTPDENSKERYQHIDEYYSTDKLKEFLVGCDYIISILPNTKDTIGMLNDNVLEVCKDRAPIFINVGRGGVISDESLLNALDKNWLSHAYLDVFNEEPLPPTSKFWTSSKITITPHVACKSRARDIAEQFAQTMKLAESGSLLKIPTIIDFARGY